MQSTATILVTGGAGFIGSNYIKMAAEAHVGWAIRVVDALTYSGNLANLAGLEDRIEFVQGDIADVAVVDEVVRGCDGVINFAAETHVDRSLMDSRPFIHSNVLGTQVLLDGCRRHGVGRFLQVSTDEVYGDLSGTSRRSIESDALRPRSPYAASKAAAECLVQAAQASFGLNTVITRGSNTYGPHQFPEKIIPLFITNALDDEPLPVYGRGDAVRDYMHVEDHCSGIDLVFHDGATGGVYNLGAGVETNGCQVAQRVLDALGKPESLISFVQDRLGHDYRYAVDASAARSLGWSPRWTFDEGLQETVVWYTQNQRWWRATGASRSDSDEAGDLL